MNYSFWEKKYIQTLCDVTIIGAGIVGLSTAISIKEKHPWFSVKILERGSLPYGASTKNAGFSCFGSVSELLDDIQKIGEKQTMEIVKMRYEGLRMLKARISPSSLEYEHTGGTEIFRKSDKILKAKCLDSVQYCNALMQANVGLENCYVINKNEILSNFDTACIHNAYEGTINPVSMMNELYKKATGLGVVIHYGVDVEKIDHNHKTIFTKHQLEIDYKKLIICTNGFTKTLFPDLDVSPARNQVLITEKLKDNPLVSGYHLDQGYIYFRNYEGRILLGGGRNLDLRGETTDQFGNTDSIQNYLLQILDLIYPDAHTRVYHWWSGILGVGSSKYPICRWADHDVLLGVRLGGMGVAIGSYLGSVLAEEVTGK